jgi:hypothetical protein
LSALRAAAAPGSVTALAELRGPLQVLFGQGTGEVLEIGPVRGQPVQLGGLPEDDGLRDAIDPGLLAHGLPHGPQEGRGGQFAANTARVDQGVVDVP